MPRTNFENLEFYQLSEKLADEIWRLIKSCALQIQLEPILQKAPDEVQNPILDALPELQGDR
jgi:hypothetical protein